MGQGALCVLILLGLFGVTLVRNEDDVTRCWVKGKEVTASPLQCPAEFDGADAKFCCRICYGANCCLPRKARVNQSKCPRETRLARAAVDRAPGAKTTAPPKKKEDLGFVALGFVLFIVVGSGLAGLWCSLRSKWCENCCNRDEDWNGDRTGNWILDREGQLRTRANIQFSTPELTSTPSTDIPPSYTPRSAALPPYSSADPQVILRPPPSYPENPVVAFRRSGSQLQDDGVVILPLPADRPDVAVSRSAPEGAEVPEEAASGNAPAVADQPDEADSGGDPKEASSDGTPEVLDLPEEASSGGAPELLDLPEEASSGGVPEVAASGNALNAADLPEVAACGSAPEVLDLPEGGACGTGPELPE